MNAILLQLAEPIVKRYETNLQGGLLMFMKQRIQLTMISMLVVFVIGYIWQGIHAIFFSVAIGCLCYQLPLYTFEKYIKKQQRLINEAFLIWILQLEALVLTSNISNAIKKSVAFCPAILKEEIQELASQVEVNPMHKPYYQKFLQQYETSDIREVMLSLYQFNFVKKEQLVYDFEKIHKRIDDLKLGQQQLNYRIQADNWGLLLMSCPILGMVWSMFFCVQLNEIIFNMI